MSDTVGLREFFQRQLDDLRTMLDERHATSTEAVKTALAEQQRALQVSVVTTDKRLDLLNELRGDIPTRAEIKALETLVNGLMSRLDRIDGKGLGLASGYQILIGLVATAIAVYLALKGH